MLAVLRFILRMNDRYDAWWTPHALRNQRRIDGWIRCIQSNRREFTLLWSICRWLAVSSILAAMFMGRMWPLYIGLAAFSGAVAIAQPLKLRTSERGVPK